MKGFYVLIKINFLKGQPGGVVVKFARSALVAWRSQVWTPGMDLYTARQAMLYQHPTYKAEEDWHRCQLSDNLPNQKKKGGTGMLAGLIRSHQTFKSGSRGQSQRKS